MPPNVTTPNVFDSKFLVEKFVEDQKNRHADPDAYKGYRFPMPWFMQKTGGWGRDWLCYVYGKAGQGKTSVMATAATQAGRDNVRFLYSSLEEGLFTVIQRILVNLQPINRTKFRDIKLDATDWAGVYAAAQQAEKFQGFWSWGLYTETELIQAVKDVEPQILFLDYLQLMSMPGKSMTESVAAASKLLVKIKKGYYTNGKPICVIAGCQLNDDGHPLGSRDPQRDADLIVKIASIDVGGGQILPDQRVFSIEKARHGDLATTKIAFFGGRSMVGELASGANTGPIPRP